MKHLEVVLGIAVGSIAGWLVANYRSDQHITEITKTMRTLAKEHEDADKRIEELMLEHAAEIKRVEDVEKDYERQIEKLQKAQDKRNQDNEAKINDILQKTAKTVENVKVEGELKVAEYLEKVSALEEEINVVRATCQDDLERIQSERLADTKHYENEITRMKIEYQKSLETLKTENNKLVANQDESTKKAFNMGFQAGQKAERTDQAAREKMAAPTE